MTFQERMDEVIRVFSEIVADGWCPGCGREVDFTLWSHCCGLPDLPRAGSQG